MKTTILFGLAIAFGVTACATTDGLAPEVARSGFDNTGTVTIANHGTACSSFTCTTLGAQWNAKTPADAILMVGVTSTAEYRAIGGTQLNIDGKITALNPTPAVTAFGSAAGLKSSTKGFSTDVATIRSIVAAKRVWLRIQTPTGTMEGAIIDGDTDSKAYHALKRFLAAVDAQTTAAPSR